MAATEKTLGGFWTSVALTLFTALMLVASWFWSDHLRWSYLAVVVLMLLFVATLGLKISGRPAGILINERNLMSLSRFQMVAWTLIILAAYLSAAIARIRNEGIEYALEIALDPRLWALMGISTASLIGSPLVQTAKKTKELDDKAVDKAQDALAQKGVKEAKAEIKDNAQGTLYSNKDIKDAAFSDMFEGDEVGNTAYVDVAKVQMFFFTIVALLAYAVGVFSWLPSVGHQFGKVDFPVLSDGLIALLGISHAGFLVSKANDHTQPPRAK
jgi:hypothetical protein